MAYRDWMADIPCQFIGKKNIDILISAFAKQIEELEQVYEDLKTKTSLDTAKGQNLRYVGDIMATSVKEAQTILKDVSNEEIQDETYRKVLQYKALKNSCDCTYSDIMDSINLLWDSNSIKYVEPPERPGTVFITLPEATIDGMDPAVGRVLAIKPAGVAMLYTVDYVAGVNISGIEKTQLPKMIMKIPGVKLANEVIPGISVSVDVQNEEKTETSVIIYYSYWVLDGTYSLDGTKKLNAKKTEEVL